MIIHMWQSQVEIERYSVVYFDRITAFEGAVTQYFHYTMHMSPTLNRSSALQRFKRCKASKMGNGIMFGSTQDCHIYSI